MRTSLLILKSHDAMMKHDACPTSSDARPCYHNGPHPYLLTQLKGDLKMVLALASVKL